MNVGLRERGSKNDSKSFGLRNLDRETYKWSSCGGEIRCLHSQAEYEMCAYHSSDYAEWVLNEQIYGILNGDLS